MVRGSHPRRERFCLTVKTDGGEQRFTARRVVGADGASSLVRRTFYREPKTRYTAIQQWFPAGENRAPFYSCIFDPVTSESCSWIIRKDDTLILAVAFLHRTAGKPIIDRKADWRSTWGIRWAAPLRPRPARRCVHAAFRILSLAGMAYILLGKRRALSAPAPSKESAAPSAAAAPWRRP